MQGGLRNVGRTTRSLKITPQPVLRSLQASRRNETNWTKWVTEKIMPVPRAKDEAADIEARKHAAHEEGKRNIFETVKPNAAPDAKAASSAEAKAAGKYGPRVDKLKLKRPTPTFHEYSTSNFKISNRKLNMIGRQIAGKPIDHAILQMQFSEKRVSTRIMHMLCTAKCHAVNYKHLEKGKLVVSEAWVTKGHRTFKRMEPRARGHMGIRVHPSARLHVKLKEGKTYEEKKKEEREYKLKRIVSSAYTREDKPLRNPGHMWAW